MDATLLNSQKQDLYQAMRGASLDPAQFDWATKGVRGADGNILRTISVSRSKARPEFKFVFDVGANGYTAQCSPWQGSRNAAFKNLTWNQCLVRALDWATAVTAELNTPDPWQSLSALATSTDLQARADVTNTEFSNRETEQLAKGIEEIRRLLIASVGGSTEQAAEINSRMDSLEQASRRMGRKDWLVLAIGTLASLGITAGVTPETTRQAFEILKNTLTGIIQLVPHVLAAGQPALS